MYRDVTRTKRCRSTKDKHERNKNKKRQAGKTSRVKPNSKKKKALAEQTAKTRSRAPLMP